MTAVSDKWLNQRQPPTGPQGAPTGDVGALLRIGTARGTLEELTLASPADPILNNGTANPFIVSLASPSPTKRYQVMLNTSMIQSADTAIYEVFPSWSYDGGSSWNDEPTLTGRYVGSNLTTDGPWACYYVSELILGSAMAGGGIPAAAPSLTVRFMVELLNGGVILPDVAGGFAQLTEYAP